MRSPTERERMLAGELYLASDPELGAARRRGILRELLGSAGERLEIEPPFRCDYGWNVRVGDRFYANFDCVMLDVNPIDIGDDVLLGPGVHLYAATHPADPAARASGRELGAPITIEKGVWLGGRVVVCPGVRVGAGTTVAAGSVVTRDLPPRVVAAGVPARIVRRLD